MTVDVTRVARPLPSPRSLAPSGPLPVRTLLVEDDDGDALLVQELLEDTALPVDLIRVRTLAEARMAGVGVDCVLLDLGLPDTEGLGGLHTMLEVEPRAAVLVLTGYADEHSGLQAVAAGAQDYLVKGQVDAELLGRSIRYALERRRADESMRRLYESELHAAENARLERGLLPTPLLTDPVLSCIARYRPGRRRSLLGGDFYDVIEREDGSLCLLIGDVAGHGPDEAALGVCLRIGWRTLVLAGIEPARILPILDGVLVRERRSEEVFATLCMLVVQPGRDTGRLWLAGHPAPLLLPAPGQAEPARQLPDDLVGPALGVVPGVDWGSVEVALGAAWRLLLFTDGIVEGHDGDGPERLGSDGLIRLLAQAGPSMRDARSLADHLLDCVETLHGGELTDDVALVLVTSDPDAATR